MNYTQNIQLPQWVESDRIRMDDFNEAMVKIDEGIAEAAKQPIVKLAENVLSSDEPSIELMLDAVPLAEFRQITFTLQGKVSEADTALCLRVNGDAGENYYSASVGENGRAPGSRWSLFSRFNRSAVCQGALLPVGIEGKLGIHWYAGDIINGYMAPVYCGGLHQTLLFTELSRLTFLPAAGKLCKGTAAAVYGLRK